MSDQDSKNHEQALCWNGAGSQGWTAMQEVLDHVFQPFENLLLGAISPPMNSRVLDIGCGTGGTTVAAARRLGASGECTGIDIAERMIVAARARAANEHTRATFIVADAQTHPFERGCYDTFISRFGVTFFSNSVAAFTNLHHAAAPGARLRCLAWQGPNENPFMTAAEHAAAPLLPDLPARQVNEPGQFAFADRDRVHAILQSSGWSAIDIQPVAVPCVIPEHALVPWLTQLGPVGRALERQDTDLRARVIAAVRPAFDSYVRGLEVHFTAACWLIEARA